MNWPKGDPGLLVRRLVKGGDTVVDVGAAQGHVTSEMLERVGISGRVIAIEPRETPELTALTAKYPTLTLHHVLAGAANRNGALAYTLTLDGEQSSQWPENCRPHPEGLVRETVTRPVIALDWLLARQPADLVKVDTQGADGAVLAGASDLLRRCPFWIVEAWPQGLERAGSSALAVFWALADAGLTVRSFDDQPITAAQVREWQTTAGSGFVNWWASRS